VKVLSKELKETRLRYTETVQELDNAKQKLAEQRPAGITAEEEQHIRKGRDASMHYKSNMFINTKSNILW
jgi:hypothetical protein